MPNFESCPACESKNIMSYSFTEGSIFSCRSCSLQWARRNPDLFPDIVENPDSLYMKPESIAEPAKYRPYVDFFARSEKILKKTKFKILDVGCGSGVFISAGTELGHDIKGIERDPLLAQFMPKHVKDRVIFKAAEQLTSEEGLFDVITFWDSFEHIDDPFTVLKTVSKNLTENGIIFLRVNNRRDIYNFITSLALKIFPSHGQKILQGCFNFPDHVWNFSETPMRRMLEKSGFSVLFFRPDDTPAERLTSNKLLQIIFKTAYIFNKAIGGGKIGEYYLHSKGMF